MIAYQRVVDAFRNEGLNVVERGRGRASAQAPGHSDDDTSVVITAIEGQVLVHCHSDETADVLESLGLEPRDLFDSDKGVEYKYGDGRTVRRGTDKSFYQSGNTKGSQLYHVDRLKDAQMVYVVEGEKDVHALEAIGLVATSTAGGAGKAHLFDLAPLYGKEITIVRDNDAAGEKHARQLMDMLSQHCQITVVKTPHGKDAADHVAATQSADGFEPDPDFLKRVMLNEIFRELKVADGMDTQDAISHLYGVLDRVQPASEEKAFYEWEEAREEWWEWLDAATENDVIPTPWDFINVTLAGGLHRKRSYIFAGRPGEGKSISLTNIAIHAAKLGFKVVIYSLEMDRMEIISRMMAATADAEYGQITRRDIDEHNMVKLATASDQLSGAKIWISERASITIEQAEIECRQLNAQHDIDLFLFDYAQLLDAKGNIPTEEKLSRISKGVRRIAKDNNAASIAAAQLNRDNVKADRPPVPSDLRGSGSLEQDADVIILIHHRLFEGMPTGEVDFIFGKNRTGSVTTHSMDWKPYRAKIA